MPTGVKRLKALWPVVLFGTITHLAVIDYLFLHVEYSAPCLRIPHLTQFQPKSGCLRLHDQIRSV